MRPVPHQLHNPKQRVLAPRGLRGRRPSPARPARHADGSADQDHSPHLNSTHPFASRLSPWPHP